MSNVEFLREQIAELDAAVAEAGEAASPATQMALAGMSDMRERLEADIQVALRPALEVVLEGDPVVEHEIRIDAFARLLHSLQESVSSVAQALTGKATAFSSLPGPLRDQTAFSLSATYTGSFGATLRGPVDPHTAELLALGQELLFEPTEQTTLLDQAVDTVLDLLVLAGDHTADDDPIVEAVLPLGSRAYKHLLNLTGAIVDDNMTARMEWKHLGAEPRRVVLDKPAARHLDDVLRMNRVTEKPGVLVGRLGTVSDIRNRVELQTDEGAIIPAKVADEVVSELADYYTHRVQADVIVTTARSAATGHERNSYLVTALALIEDPPQTSS